MASSDTAVLVILQEVDQEVNDLYAEFQMEKEDLLDSIRVLQQQMLLKDAVIAAFIPQVCSFGVQWFLPDFGIHF